MLEYLASRTMHTMRVEYESTPLRHQVTPILYAFLDVWWRHRLTSLSTHRAE